MVVACTVSMILIFIVTINTLSYVRLRKINKRKKRKTRSQTTTNNNSQKFDNEMVKSDKRKLEAVKTLIIMTFFYVACSLPIIIHMIFRASDKEDQQMIPEFSNAVWISNSGINGVIYLLRTKELRRYYIELLNHYF